MSDLTQIELQNIKKIIQNSSIEYEKLNEYISNELDIQVKQLFTKVSQQALNTKQKLISFLNN